MRQRHPLCMLLGRSTLFASCALQLRSPVRQLSVPPPPLHGGRSPVTPPAVGVTPLKAKLPPPPLLPGKHVPMGTSAAVWRTPPEVLAALIDFVPTFFVPLNSVAAILPDDVRMMVKQKAKFVQFIRRYPFYFDLRLVDGLRYDIRLRDDVQHPRRGSADPKFTISDIGEIATYSVRPEYVISFDNIDSKADVNVALRPEQPPPSVQVRLEERVPVLERLKTLVSADFVSLEDLEERVPEDIIFHPYFDCQGGLPAIVAKFPDIFQVVDGAVRLKPRHLAPLAVDEFSFDTSPLPAVIAKVQEVVGAHDIPVWVSITLLYERLSPEERRSVKKSFRSFATFLRAHGSSLAVSNDLLKVSKWTVPAAAPEQNATDAIRFTHTHIVNELFDKFPRNKTLSLPDALRLLPASMTSSMPKNVAGWLHSHSNYFIVEGADVETDPSKIKVRRASDRAALDVALLLYPHVPDDGIAMKALMAKLPDSLRKTVDQIGMASIVENLAEWLQLLDGDLFRTKSVEELEAAISAEAARRRGDDDDDDTTPPV